MKAVTVLCVAVVFFLSGMMTGFHISHEQYKEMQGYALSTGTKEEKQKTAPEKEENDLAEDLLRRQDHLQENEGSNVFSSIGKSLDVFDPSS